MSKENIDENKSIEPRSDSRVSERSRSLGRGLDAIFDDFRRSFDNLMAPFMPMRTAARTGGRLPTRYPLCDLVDQGEKYLVRAELPGLNKDNVDVEVNKDTLRIQAEIETREQETEGDYIHRERTYSQLSRTVRFPEEVDPSKVKGTMKDGVLELKVTKKEPKPEERMTRVELE